MNSQTSDGQNWLPDRGWHGKRVTGDDGFQMHIELRAASRFQVIHWETRVREPPKSVVSELTMRKWEYTIAAVFGIRNHGHKHVDGGILSSANALPA
jgi:hypothetical protein